MAEMQDDQEGQRYQGIPTIPQEVIDFISGSFIPDLIKSESLDDMLQRVDEEMTALRHANPRLAQLVAGTVAALEGTISEALSSELARVYLRVYSHFNSITLLRALDMAWREQQPS